MSYAYLANENEEHGDGVAQGRVHGLSLLQGRHLWRAHENPAEDEAVEHAGHTDAQHDPHGHEDHLPAPRHEPVQLEREEDELQRIHREEHFQLEAAVVLDGPHARTHAGHATEDERDEHEHPQVIAGAETVAGQELEHEQDEVQGQADEHRLELHVRVGLDAVVGVPAPADGPHHGPQRRNQLPEPEGGKDRPYRPVWRGSRGVKTIQELRDN